MTQRWDLVVVGTGFGGSMVALAAGGARPRGGLIGRGRGGDLGLRSRYPGFCSDLVDWPIGYAALAPFYDRAERLWGVAGVAGRAPNEPPREEPYAAAPPPFSAPARRVAAAAEAIGLKPFPIPLAINFASADGRRPCVQCLTCDLFPCKIGAKNDLSVTVLPTAIAEGATVLHSTLALRLRRDGARVSEIECLDTTSGERFSVACRVCVVSAGAIPSPALLLASGLGAVEPNGSWVRRCLMRHCSGLVVGVFGASTK